MSRKEHRTAILAWMDDDRIHSSDLFFIKGLKEVCKRLIIVVRNQVKKEVIETLKYECDELFVTEQYHGSFSLWKVAMLHLKLKDNDELVFSDTSMYGPIFSFEEIFARMTQSSCDVWKITSPSAKHNNSERYLSDFSYFVCKSRVCSLKSFYLWWQTLSPICSDYNAATSLLSFFKSSDVKVAHLQGEQQEKLDFTDSLSLNYADRIIRDKIPVIKKSLFVDSCGTAESGLGIIPSLVLRQIQFYTSFPVDTIVSHMLSTMKMSSIKSKLGLNYIVPSTPSRDGKSESRIPAERSVSLVCYVYYPDLVDNMLRYIKSMPEKASIYIISSSQETIDTYRARLKNINFFHKEFRIKPNQGRDISALLVTAKDIVETSDYICFIHDKKSKHFDSDAAEGHTYHCLECSLHNSTYVNGVLNLFETNSYLGMLVPPPVNFGPYNIFGFEIGDNMESTKKAYQMLKLTSPFDDAPVASFGTYFWARGKALKKLYSRNWQIEDFPNEPMPKDATISHGIERVIPMAVQDSGFCTAWSSPDSYAELYENQLGDEVREINKRLFAIFGYKPLRLMLDELDSYINAASSLNDKLASSENVKYLKRKYRIRKCTYTLLDLLTFGIKHKSFKRNLRKLKRKIKAASRT